MLFWAHFDPLNGHQDPHGQRRTGRDVRDVRVHPCYRTKNGVGLKLSKKKS